MAVCQDFSCRKSPPAHLHLTYYDTFDWRLNAANLRLYRQQHEQDSQLVLESLKGDVPPSFTSLSTVPKFAWELPASAIRQYIEPIIEMRALLPVAEIKSREDTLRITNKEQKTVATLTLQQDDIVLTSNHRQALPPRLVLHAVKGYENSYQKTRKKLEQDIDLTVLEFDQLLAALQQQGIAVNDYSSKLKIQLEPQARADLASKSILKRLYQTMLANEAGLKTNIDSEFLHDYRVAIRRTRSILTQLKGVFADTSAEHFKQEFAWLGEITGPLRDLDVHLLQFDSYADNLPAAHRAALLPLKEYLFQVREQRHQGLLQDLASKRYTTIQAEWPAFLDKETISGELPENAAAPIQELAKRNIWRSYRKVMKQAGALSMSSPAAAFHELRKSCKKLRYLMEIFQSLYTGNEIKQLIKHLKILQDNLGEYQDLDVQSLAIKQFAREMEGHGIGRSDTYMAMGILVGALQQKKLAVHQEFIACYTQFARHGVQQGFAHLFKPVNKQLELSQ